MNQRKVILFAGTTEGRVIAEAMGEHKNAEIHVATEYGKNLLPNSKDGYKVCDGRLNQEAMVKIMGSTETEISASDENILEANKDKPLVVDATHPYAVEVTENIKKAAEETGAEYYRVLRGEDSQVDWKNQFKDQIIYAENIQEAADILDRLGEKGLITTGSKELMPFTKVKGYKELLTVRILPLAGAFKSALDAGFEGQNLIAMQGPFSVEMNRALIGQTGAKVLVTKESGKQGGFIEKLMACAEENIKAVVIKRPSKENGYTVAEMLDILENKGVKISRPVEGNTLENNGTKDLLLKNQPLGNNENLKRWFPVFEDSKGKNVLIVGGGAIATRRVETLIKFQCHVTVWAKEVSEKIEKIKENGQVEVSVRELETDQVENIDFNQYHMIIAATDNIKLNEEICRKARKLGKLFNDAGCKENCNFYFPAVSVKGNVTVGINGQGKDHKLVRQVREDIDKLLGDKYEG